MICANDDKGCNCIHCSVNPVVLIATHERVEITKRCIESVLSQSLKPKVVLVVSKWDEHDIYKFQWPELEVIVEQNHPLGAKWQSGVIRARKFNPNPLIILGSDDLMGKDFVKNMYYVMMGGVHFVGINKWYLVEENKAYKLQYAFQNFPLGGGRAYSLRLLNHIDFKIFDTSRSRHLDDKGWEAAQSGPFKSELVDAEEKGLVVVSVKGKWPTMNPTDKILAAPKRIKVLDILEKDEVMKLV